MSDNLQSGEPGDSLEATFRSEGDENSNNLNGEEKVFDIDGSSDEDDDEEAISNAKILTFLSRASGEVKNSDSNNVNEYFTKLIELIEKDETMSADEKSFLYDLCAKKLKMVLPAFHGNPTEICQRCKQETYSKKYCENCMRNFLEANFDNWSSGHEVFDKLIRESQLRAPTPGMFIEWIPFKSIKNIEYIARGGFGTIFKADWIDGSIEDWDDSVQEYIRSKPCTVVLKCVDKNENMSDAYLQEAKTLFSFRVNDIVRCYGITRNVNGEYLIVMQYYIGGSLREALQKFYDTLNWRLRIQIMSDIAHSLRNIHDAGMVHRDLHSGNVLYDGVKCVIGDLGFCGSIEQVDSDQIVGVIGYLAPEVLRRHPYTPKSDIYSFGMLMWEVFSGHMPFYDQRYDAAKLALEICRGLRPKIFRKIPIEYKDLMLKCWDAYPENRPTADQLCEEFVNIYAKAEIYEKEFEGQERDLLEQSKPISKITNVHDLPEPCNAAENEQIVISEDL